MRKRIVVPKGHVRWELLDYKTKEPSGLFTCLNYEIYKNRKTKKKYVRSEKALLFKGDDPPDMPPAIEFTDPPEDWKKVQRRIIYSDDSQMRLINAYVSMKLLNGGK